MSKNKLFKFAEIAKMAHVFEPKMDTITADKFKQKGNWKKVFQNKNPIVLELGCGKGEYTVALAQKYPNKNFIGVDIKGNRIYEGAKQSLEFKLKNSVFLRTKVDFIHRLFGPNEVEEIWLTFSDPQPKKPNKRLTSPIFINRYLQILKPEGFIHLKTDSDILFEFTEEEIKKQGYKDSFVTWDLYRDIGQLPEEEQEIVAVKTHYETIFTQKGSKIKYCKFKIT